MYKNFLDQQRELKNVGPLEEEQEPQLILPSYNYLNRPVAIIKKAKDSIELIKNNKLFESQQTDMSPFFKKEVANHTLIDYGSGRDYYLGDTRLRHNPITQPVNNGDYNKYINKYKHNGSSPNINNNNDGSTLSKIGNQIIA